MEDRLNKKETDMFFHLHEATTPEPLRNSIMVPGYTGYIPGRVMLYGKTYAEEVKIATALCVKRQLQWESYKNSLVQGPNAIPEYFSMWYEIPVGKHHVCHKCINTKSVFTRKYCS